MGRAVAQSTAKLAQKLSIDYVIIYYLGYALAHTEDAEEEGTLRACTMAYQMNCPLYLTHLSTKSSLDIIEEKKSKHHVVFGEITPASLACDGKGYWNTDWTTAAALVASPPMRKGQCDDLATSLSKDDHGLGTYGFKQSPMIREF